LPPAGALEGEDRTVIIKQAEVSTRGERCSGVVTLTLTREADGWTYRVDGMTDDRFTMTWRAKTPEGATRKLQDAYDPEVWQMTVKDSASHLD
jgi:hypothetical protein